MKLHILEQGKDNNKNIMEMIEACKHVINIPTTVEDLMIIINAFAGLAAILFGKKSSLPRALRLLHQEMELNRLLLKGKVKNDPGLIAKLMFAVDNRIQLWFGYLRRASDREDVSDAIINFTLIMNEVVLDQFHVVLPPTFTLSKTKEVEEDVQPITKKPKKNKTPKEGEDRKVVNKDVPNEFRLLEGENYRKTLRTRMFKSARCGMITARCVLVGGLMETASRIAGTRRATLQGQSSQPTRREPLLSTWRFAGGDESSGRSVAVSDLHLHQIYQLHQHHKSIATNLQQISSQHHHYESKSTTPRRASSRVNK